MKDLMKMFSPARALGAVVVAASLIACRDARTTDTARDAELKSDLELASTSMNLAPNKVDPSFLDSLETRPQGAPKAATVVKKGHGPRVIASRTPTVRAAQDPEPAAAETADVTQTVAQAPAPDVSEPVAVAPRPAPVDAQPAGDYGTGGGGVFGGGGGIGGVIIRGGGVDGDNCDLHTRGGRRGTTRGPIYMPTIPVATQPSMPDRGAGGRRGGWGGIGGAATDTRRPDASQPTGTAPRSRPVTRRGGF